MAKSQKKPAEKPAAPSKVASRTAIARKKPPVIKSTVVKSTVVKSTAKRAGKVVAKGSAKAAPAKTVTKTVTKAMSKPVAKAATKTVVKAAPVAKAPAKAVATKPVVAAKPVVVVKPVAVKPVAAKPGVSTKAVPVVAGSPVAKQPAKGAKAAKVPPAPAVPLQRFVGPVQSTVARPVFIPLRPAVKGASANGEAAPAVRKKVRKKERGPILNPPPLPPAPVTTDSKAKKNLAGFGTRDLEMFRELLLEKRRELVGDMSSMEREALRSVGTNLSNLPMHMADMGTDNYEQEFTLGLVEKDRNLLREINLALAKIQNGTFGICEGTNQPITRPRLEAQPWARYSIEWARQKEKGIYRR